MNALELTGRARTHVIELDAPRCTLHYEAVAAFLGMRDAARAEGIDLQAVSSFRDFDRQLVLWNRKWRGDRPLYDRSGALSTMPGSRSRSGSTRSWRGPPFRAAAGTIGDRTST